MLYQVAYLKSEGKPSHVRLGSATSENEAAHSAFRWSRRQQCDMCVVEENTDKVVQTVYSYPEKGK
jgi:hypothetical protein